MRDFRKILAIETSCDETAAAVYEPERGVLSSIVASQGDLHAPFGGVVPELASRRHLQMIYPVVKEALSRAATDLGELDGVAVTMGPGLVGSLLVGLSVAKSLAYTQKIPFLGINHLEGHIAAAFLDQRPPAYPFTALVVSGGHTHLFQVEQEGRYQLLGRTRDDAAGEAFDKVSKLLGLGYPGGPVIERASRSGDPGFVPFPRGMVGDGSFDLSFSGLKTAVLYYLEGIGFHGADPEVKDRLRADIAASFQQAAIEMCARTTLRAALAMRSPRIVLVGGVACNRALRSLMGQLAQEAGIDLYCPRPDLCTDNAAMIAVAGWRRLAHGEVSPLSLNASARLPLA